MDRQKTGKSWLLGLACLSVLGGILVAGLWPFWPPRNAVTWMGSVNGLSFGDYGAVLSSGAFQGPNLDHAAPCTLEIWVRPGRVSDSNSFLSFSTPENPQQLLLQQYRANLLLRRVIGNDPRRNTVMGIADVFRDGKPRFITITSSQGRTAMYVDGILGDTSPQFLPVVDLAGELLIGTSPVVNEHWRGQLRGLAIYDGELTAAQVLEHFEAWTMQGRPPLMGSGVAGSARTTALYLFDEHAGNIVHNAIRPGIDLNIPERFFLLRPEFLEPFWREYKPGWGYWRNNLINVLGFIPLGFLFFAYLSSARPIKHAVLAVVALGFAVSLTIEVSQAYLPTRASGTTDLITNMLGTLIGVVLCSSEAGKNLMARFSVLGGKAYAVDGDR